MWRQHSGTTVQVTQTSADPELARERLSRARFSLRAYQREGAQIVPLHPGSSVVVGRTAPSDVSAKTAQKIAAALVAAVAEAKSQPAVVICGIAAFPDAAAHSEELLGESRAAAPRATAESPIQVAHGQEPRMFNRAEGLGPFIVAQSGETGTEKEVLSRYLHDESPRKSKPLVCVTARRFRSSSSSRPFGHERGAFTGANAQQKGVFEAGDGGTVFLDEIGELPAAAQAALDQAAIELLQGYACRATFVSSRTRSSARW